MPVEALEPVSDSSGSLEDLSEEGVVEVVGLQASRLQ